MADTQKTFTAQIFATYRGLNGGADWTSHEGIRIAGNQCRVVHLDDSPEDAAKMTRFATREEAKAVAERRIAFHMKGADRKGLIEVRGEVVEG